MPGLKTKCKERFKLVSESHARFMFQERLFLWLCTGSIRDGNGYVWYAWRYCSRWV